MECPFDRTAEDLGNVVALEHVNMTVPDQQVATIFYVTGWIDARSIPDDRHRQYVDQCRALPVPSARRASRRCCAVTLAW